MTSSPFSFLHVLPLSYPVCLSISISVCLSVSLSVHFLKLLLSHRIGVNKYKRMSIKWEYQHHFLFHRLCEIPLAGRNHGKEHLWMSHAASSSVRCSQIVEFRWWPRQCRAEDDDRIALADDLCPGYHQSLVAHTLGSQKCTATSFYLHLASCRVQPVAAGCIIFGGTWLSRWCGALNYYQAVHWYSFCRPRKDGRLSQPPGDVIRRGLNSGPLDPKPPP